MARPLTELAELSTYYNAPILCAGDIFDHWKAEPQLINFALNNLPHMYAIPGQHDLPLHNIDLLKKSAWWTLALAEKIEPLIYEEPISIVGDIVIHAFPWGRKLTPLKKGLSKDKYHIALVHDYFWMKEYKYPTAPKKHHISRYIKAIKGYHAVVFGDNHKGFKTKVNDVPVYNCGTLMRRRSDEKEYEPRIGLLCRSGKILIHKTSLRSEKLETQEEDMSGQHRISNGELSDFIDGLRDAETLCVDYVEAIEMLMKNYSVSNEVRKILLEALGRG
jgi:DNA repair exonuclease SbcCD nuclease subunit